MICVENSFGWEKGDTNCLVYLLLVKKEMNAWFEGHKEMECSNLK